MHLAMFSGDHDDVGQGSRIGLVRTLLVLALLVLLIGIGTRTLFFVDETEYVYVTQFGQPLRLCTEAGLGIKWPYQSVRRFDRRLQIFGPPPREILTEDKENLEFEWFVCWRLPGSDYFAPAADGEADRSASREQVESHVERFMQSVGTIDAAERRLEERVQAAIAATIGQTRLSQIVSLESSELALEEISEKVTRSIRAMAAAQFGIEVVDIRLKRFGYPDSVKASVYDEIRSERAVVAGQYRAQGESEKKKIESEADLQRDQLLAQAQREATMIRGEGEAKAIEILNAAHAKDPKFFEFLKKLDTYRDILDDQTTVVLSSNSPLLKLLTEGLPELEGVPEPGDAAAPNSGDGSPE